MTNIIALKFLPTDVFMVTLFSSFERQIKYLVLTIISIAVDMEHQGPGQATKSMLSSHLERNLPERINTPLNITTQKVKEMRFLTVNVPSN